MLPRFNRKAKALFGGNMMYPISRCLALFNALFFVINMKFPLVPKLRAISALITVILIVVVIAVGGIIIYFVVVAPGVTTTVYP